MREHIKLFESEQDLVHEFMGKYGILKYEITPQGVDVHQNVKLEGTLQGLITELPFQFNEIHGGIRYVHIIHTFLIALVNIM